jgi:hypothetical protein
MSSEGQFVPFYEDDDFIIRKSNMGEYGGTICFLDKNLNKVYGTAGHHLINVHRSEGEYQLPAYFPMVPDLQILYIDDPTKLFELKDSVERFRVNWREIIPDNNKERTPALQVVIM